MFSTVISDLHLGTRTGADLLSRPEPRGRLLEEVAEADHVVLLGDSVELRDDPVDVSLERALPFFLREFRAASARARSSTRASRFSTR